MATHVKDESLDPKGYQQIVGAAAATGLTVPTGSRYALIQAVTQDARWRDDGTAPTGTVGMLISAGDSLFYSGELDAVRIIEVTPSTELNITYYA